MRADDTPAILAVLNADKKRLELIEQEKTLTAEYEKGSTEAGNKLKEVCVVVYSQYLGFVSFVLLHMNPRGLDLT